MPKASKPKTNEYRVYRYWTVEYRSIAYVQASSPEEAAKLALEDDDYSDSAAVDGSEGPTEIGQIVEIKQSGREVEHVVPEMSDE